MLKVSPWKGVIRFGKRGKLNPRYIRPFKILAKVGTVAYQLELPEKLSCVHSTFHVSNLKKCLSNEPLAIPLDEIHIDEKLNFIEEPVEIMDHEVKRLKQSRIPIVKIGNQSQGYREPDVGSPPSRVILFGDIPTVIPSTSVIAPETSTIAPAISSAAPVVETTLVASPTGLCGLVPYTGSDSDTPDEVRPPSQDPYVAIRCSYGGADLQRRKCITSHLQIITHLLPRSSSDLPSSFLWVWMRPDQAHSGSSTREYHLRSRYPHEESTHDIGRAYRPSGVLLHYLLCIHRLHLSHHQEIHQRDPCIHLHILQDHLVRDVDHRSISVSLSMASYRIITPTVADNLPPRKGSEIHHASEASLEEDAEVGLTETGVDVGLGIGDGDVVGDRVGIDHRDATDDTEEYEADASTGGTAEADLPYDYLHVIEEEVYSQLERDVGADHYSSGDRARMAEAIYSLRFSKRDRDISRRLRRLESYLGGVTAYSISKFASGARDDNGNGNGNGNRCDKKRKCKRKCYGAGNGNGLMENGDGNETTRDNGDGNENPNVNGRGVGTPHKRTSELMRLRFDHGEADETDDCSLPDNIQGNVIADRTLQDYKIASNCHNLMDSKVEGYAVRNARTRTLDNN
ncbi:hypothetical protein Tco_1045832 [Tanacetum coccineum]|uniref:Tf2-1-like SH3-like domain-containing protein n=1 Tax=Tanacetum coccineum TaxID=301880 RepID=A0ABQ5GVT5_9ASTR